MCPCIIFTIDVERLDYTKEQLEKFLELLKNYKIKATFFITAEQIKKHERFIKKISFRHEVCSHGFTHANLKKIPLEKVKKEISLSKKAFEKIGVKCLGFRAPYNIIIPNMGLLLKKAGYKYDSSLCRTYFPGRYNYRNILNKHYMASSRDLKKQGDGIYEIPITSKGFWKIPDVYSFYKFFPSYFLERIEETTVFNMHDLDLVRGLEDRNSFLLVRLLQKIRKGNLKHIIKELYKNKNICFKTCYEYLRAKSN